MDIVNKIANGELPLSTKIIRLWAIAMLNYRGSIGDKAWESISTLTSPETSQAIAFLTGFCMGDCPKAERLKELVPELGKDGK